MGTTCSTFRRNSFSADQLYFTSQFYEMLKNNKGKLKNELMVHREYNEKNNVGVSNPTYSFVIQYLDPGS